MKIRKLGTQNYLATEMKIADSFLTRLKGLMFINKMEGFDGLLITRCNSIHNCFVKFPIDVVFLNSKLTVVKIIKNFRPWRISGIYFKATQVLELPAGTLRDEVKVGDRLEVIDV